MASVKTVNAEKQFINTCQEAFLPSKLVVSDKGRQQGWWCLSEMAVRCNSKEVTLKAFSCT